MSDTVSLHAALFVSGILLAYFASFMAALFITFVGSLIVWHFLFLKDAGPGQKKDWSNIEL